MKTVIFTQILLAVFCLIMKTYRLTIYLFAMAVMASTSMVFSQPIPYGTSVDSMSVFWDGIYTGKPLVLYFYKPANYNSSSPIIISLHGIDGSGAIGVSYLQAIADWQNALIVAPTATYMAWARCYYSERDTSCEFGFFSTFLPYAFKKMYHYVLERESRDSIPVYLTGFSAGGQTVSRYMMVRQIEPDSIPIAMSLSVSPYSYTLPMVSFNGQEMQYPCGIAPKVSLVWLCPTGENFDTLTMAFCNTDILQYYNENYCVMVGTADTAYGTWCDTAWGQSRYAMAQYFYAFCTEDALSRGTELKWQYGEAPGIAHNGWSMYSAKAFPEDTVTIAESLLFGTLSHPMPDFSPVANYNYSDTGLTVFFSELSTNATIFNWDFGDGETSSLASPQHVYSNSGTYHVCLTVSDECLSATYCDSLTTINVGIVESSVLGNFRIYPNPISTSAIFDFALNQESDIILQIYDFEGKQIATLYNDKAVVNKQYHCKFDVNNFSNGIYLAVLRTNSSSTTIKFSVIK